MRLNEELDYETVYNGRGKEIAQMIMNNFEGNIEIVSKKVLPPDERSLSDAVGVTYKFRIYDEFLLVCSIGGR